MNEPSTTTSARERPAGASVSAMDAGDRTVGQIESCLNQLLQDRQNLEQKLEEARNLEDALADARQIAIRAAALAAERDQLRAQVQRLRDEVLDSQNRATSHQNRSTQLETLLRQSSADSESHRKHLEERVREQHALSIQLQNAINLERRARIEDREQISRTEALWSEERSRILGMLEESRSKVNALEKRSVLAENQAATLIRNHERDEAVNQQLQQRLAEAAEGLMKLNEAIGRERASLKARTEELAAAREQCALLESRILELSGENERVRKQYPVEALLKIKDQEIASAQSRLTKLALNAPERERVLALLDNLEAQKDALHDLMQKN